MKKQSKSREYMRYMLLNVSGMLGLSCYILADTFLFQKDWEHMDWQRLILHFRFIVW